MNIIITIIGTLFFVSNSCVCATHHYLYPVALGSDYNGQTIVYVLYQKDMQHIELWQWNPHTQKADKALLSSFTPAGIQMLPSHNTFSFIDEGRIRIKYPDKRQPKAIDINEPPIYNIHLISWIDEDTIYLSAQENERFGLYHVDIQGQTFCLVYDSLTDALYPQKIETDLFYIERSVAAGQGSRQHRIVKTHYPTIAKVQHHPFNDTEYCEQAILTLMYNQNTYRHKAPPAELVLDFGTTSIAFLNMISPEQGFVVEFPETIHKHDPLLTFTYHHITKDVHGWQHRPLFTFSIPAFLLLGESESRLYESILPFLPRHALNKILFSDTNGRFHGLDMMIYDMATSIVMPLTRNVDLGANFFAPIIFEDKIICGGSILVDGQAPTMHMQRDGITFTLPILELPK